MNLNRFNYCKRCNKEGIDPRTTWCDECHKKVLEEMKQREEMPCGCSSCDDEKESSQQICRCRKISTSLFRVQNKPKYHYYGSSEDNPSQQNAIKALEEDQGYDP